MNKSNRICFYLVIFIFFINIHCKENNNESLEKDFYDLTRILSQKEKVKSSSKFDEQFLKYHNKKNPGRFSGLDSENKWLNTQITFNIDSDLWVNHSRDSITMLPNSELNFHLQPGNYSLEMDLGTLEKAKIGREFSGKLILSSNQKPIKEFLLNDKNRESWRKVQMNLNLKESLKFRWETESEILFLGNPILYKKKKEMPNVILITIDALRNDVGKFSGGNFSVTPEIDQFSQDSIVFRNAFSNANWTKPSMVSYFYSEYSSNLGLGNIGFPVEQVQKQIFYSSDKKSMAEYLRQNGYYTASVMNNVFFLEYTGVGVDLGFHELIQIGKDVSDTAKITSDSIQLIENNKHRPFFLHINWNGPHGPYIPPRRSILEIEAQVKKHRFNSRNALHYYGEVKYSDEEFGKVIKALKKAGVYENSVIILTSDHGEILDDRHDASRHPHGGVVYGHGESLFDEELRVPLIIKLPKDQENKKVNKIVKNNVSLISILPTILEIVDIPAGKSELKGKSLVKYFTGTNANEDEVIYAEGRLSEMIRSNQFKYIRKYPGPASMTSSPSNFEQLYRLDTDPEELVNVATTDRKLLEIARKKMRNHFIKNKVIKITFPQCNDSCQYSGEFTTNSGIYSIDAEGMIQSELRKRSIRFQLQNKGMIAINLVKADSNFTLNLFKNREKIQYSGGKWLLKSGMDRNLDHRLLECNQTQIQTPLVPHVCVVNQVESEKKLEQEMIMQGEVRNILKSWGYIHE